MEKTQEILCPSYEVCDLGIAHLKRFWQRCQLIKMGKLSPDFYIDEWNVDLNMLTALGLGIEQTMREIYNYSYNFESFQKWILDRNGQQLSQLNIEQFNNSLFIKNNALKESSFEEVLTPADIEFWNRNGYVIVRNAVSKEDCEDTIAAICHCINIDINDASTWYNEHPQRQGIMVQFFQHRTIEKNRQSSRIRIAYEQLWQRKDITVNIDKVGFNPPETVLWKFPGSPLHWDVSLKTPIPFGLQGILYLNDTAADQGAFTVIPAFHLALENWLAKIPKGTNPRDLIRDNLQSKSIPANAGDFIIWHHSLPHSGSPNRSKLPRFVQYLNYEPMHKYTQQEWI